jgi:hypothetical protein
MYGLGTNTRSESRDCATVAKARWLHIPLVDSSPVVVEENDLEGSDLGLADHSIQNYHHRIDFAGGLRNAT